MAAYRIYISDCLRAAIGCEERYFDRINPTTAKITAVEKTGDEIAAETIKKFGLKISEKGGEE